MKIKAPIMLNLTRTTYKLYLILALCISGTTLGSNPEVTKIHSFSSKISPKSIVYSGKGLFFAQNMMYKHTITVYNRKFELVKTISDEVELSNFGKLGYSGKYQGAPVEATFSHEGKYAWVSNYQMYGEGFSNPGCDACSIGSKYDKSYIYRINTESFEIENVISCGSVPKYLCATPDDRYVLVSNWSSGDVSIINTDLNREVTKIKLGAYPRGIAISNDSKTAWVAIMGSNRIAEIDLHTYKLSNWIENIGASPRHLCLSPDGKYLYVSLNNEDIVKKIQLENISVTDTAATGKAPRSMVLNKSGSRLFVVNYFSNTFSVVRTSDMTVVETIETAGKPIGITYDTEKGNIWIACYSGVISIYNDNSTTEAVDTQEDLPEELSIVSSPDSIIETPAASEAVNDLLNAKRQAFIALLSRKKEEVAIEKATLSKPIVSETIRAVRSDEHKYHVISGCFAKKENALTHIEDLKKRGYNAILEGKSGNLYRVSCGGSSSIQEAEVLMSKAQKEISQDVWVLKR